MLASSSWRPPSLAVPVVPVVLVALVALGVLVVLGGARTVRASDDGDEEGAKGAGVAGGRAALALSRVLAAVDDGNPAVAAAVARAAAAARRATAAGAWSDPFFAVGPDEYTLGDDPPMIRYQLSQAIPLPGKLAPRVEAARAQTKIAAANVEVARRQLRVAAIQLFLRALYVDSALVANASQRQILDEVIASAEGRYITGGASAHHDVLIATAERATLERDALSLARERAVLLAQIDELMGLEPGDPSRLLIDDHADEAAVPASFATALGTQPELAVATMGVEVAAARSRAADVSALPDLVVQGMAMQSLMEEEPSSIGAMVGLSVPVQLWWKQLPQAEAAARERTAWEIERRQLELRLRAEWREAETRLKTAADTLELYDEKIKPATDAAVESSRAAYAAQGAPLIEVLTVLRARTQVDLERAAAALDVRLARVRLTNLLAMPSLLILAPSTPTLFSPSMGGGARMGGMGAGTGAAGMGSMGQARPRPVDVGGGMTLPSTLEEPMDEAGDEGAVMIEMGGM